MNSLSIYIHIQIGKQIDRQINHFNGNRNNDNCNNENNDDNNNHDYIVCLSNKHIDCFHFPVALNICSRFSRIMNNMNSHTIHAVKTNILKGLVNIGALLLTKCDMVVQISTSCCIYFGNLVIQKLAFTLLNSFCPRRVQTICLKICVSNLHLKHINLK